MMDACYSREDFSLMLGATAVCVLLSANFFYDPISGSFTTPFRQLVALFSLWAVILASWPASAIPDRCLAGMSLSLIQSGVFAISVYAFIQFIIHYLLPGVSHPGGPRDHKIQRTPKWSDNSIALPACAKNWRCTVAEESHEVSRIKFKGTAANITGEPSGRQMWTNQKESISKRKKHAFDEKLVLEMASGGRQNGVFNPSSNPNSCDQLFRGQQIRAYLASGKAAPDQSEPKTVKESLRKAAHFYSMLQTDDGHWAGDYGGPHFLMPGLVVVWYIMGQPSLMLDEEATELLKHYILVHQQVDGGWGTHIESPSTMFGTTLMYVALRLLGVGVDDPAVVRGRAFIHGEGGVIMTSSWAKFYLCLLGVMDWAAHNSVPPEMWLLPNFTPFHPGRMWCHARMVYLPMSYLYSRRYVYSRAESDPTILSLRKELYVEDYDTIPWIKTRHLVAPMDNYSPLPWMMKVIQNGLARYESWAIFQPFKNFIRSYANQFCIDYMAAEDLQTNYIDIGPVNKVLNMLSAYDGKINVTASYDWPLRKRLILF